VIEAGSSVWARRGGVGDRWLAPDAVPDQCRDPSINQHSGRWCTQTSQNGWGATGETGDAQWPISAQTMGRGIAVGRRWTIDHVTREWVRKTAGSGAMAHLSKCRRGV